MYYVYLLESISDPNCRYIGFSSNLRQRLVEHNEMRGSFQIRQNIALGE